MPRIVVILQRRSLQVAALSPVQCADTAPVPTKLDLHFDTGHIKSLKVTFHAAVSDLHLVPAC